MLVAVACPGCLSHVVGNCTLYPPDVRTVSVQMFDSASYRRGLGERLSEAVVKEIELKTPFRVVNSPEADSVLSGRLMYDNKGVLVPDPSGLPRETQVNLRVQINWTDRHGMLIRQAQAIPIPPVLLEIDQTANYVPEVGHSHATAEQEAIQRLASQIVSLMEAPW